MEKKLDPRGCRFCINWENNETRSRERATKAAGLHAILNIKDAGASPAGRPPHQAGLPAYRFCTRMKQRVASGESSVIIPRAS